MIMKHFPLVALAILLTMASGRADEQGNLFRDVYECPDRGPSSVCIYGTIPRGKQVTVLAKGWKSPAVQKEKFATNTEGYWNRIETSTRLRVAKPPPKDALMIAVLAAAPAVKELPHKEIMDEAVVERIGRHVRDTKELNLAPDIRLLKTSLLRLSPTILLSQTFMALPDDVPVLEKKLSTGCGGCQNVPLVVGQTLHDLFEETRSTEAKTEETCGGIQFAFALSGRTYLFSHAFACESDSYAATLIHDLSEDQAKLAFKLSGGF